MAIQVGEKLPSGTLKVADANGIRDVTTDELFAGKKVVLFAVPGAFTPTCSAKHLPGFVQKADEIRAKGVDAIVCLAVNDAFVMGAWGRDQQVGDKVIMAADGNADWTRALGLELDASRFGMGIRSQRFAMIVEDGVVRKLAVEAPGKFEVSSAEAILQAL
ncbi:MAG TPA: peroxiredoxin [Myxococcota bacterium]